MSEHARRVLVGGLYAGLVGYVVVVLVLSLMNLATGASPFYTAALFGAVLFYGLRDPAALEISAGPVLAYNMLHLLVFLFLGLVSSWLVTKAEEYPAARYAVLVALIFIAVHMYGALLLFAEPLLAGGAWWQLGAPSLAASIAMGWYLLWAHPALRRSLKEIPLGAEED